MERYWIQNSGNWDDTNHWSDSSGGASGASVPTADDNVHFDANSFADSTGSVHVSIASFNSGIIESTCKSLYITITSSLTCYLDFTIENSLETEIYGLFVLSNNAIWYGTGIVEELYCFPETIIYGNNYINSLVLDTDNNTTANFFFKSGSNQTINNLYVLNSSPTSQAVISRY